MPKLLLKTLGATPGSSDAVPRYAKNVNSILWRVALIYLTDCRFHLLTRVPKLLYKHV